MNMTVLNPENKLLFNHMIADSQRVLANLLPQKVILSLSEDCTSYPVEVDEDTRMDYVKTFVDEFDTFGDDLLGQPLRDIFSSCVKPKELQVLEGLDQVTPIAQYIYASIWNRAYDKTMQAVQEDILYDAEKNFEHSDVLYRKACQDYDNQREQYNAMEADQYEYE